MPEIGCCLIIKWFEKVMGRTNVVSVMKFGTLHQNGALFSTFMQQFSAKATFFAFDETCLKSRGCGSENGINEAVYPCVKHFWR